MVSFAAGSLHRVVGAGPSGTFAGVLSQFMEGLAEILGTRSASMDRMAFAAPFGDRGDPAELLDGGGIGETIAIGAKGSDQAWRQGSPGSRNGAEEFGIGMLGQVLRNEAVILGDSLVEELDLRGQGFDFQLATQDDGLISHQGARFANESEPGIVSWLDVVCLTPT